MSPAAPTRARRWLQALPIPLAVLGALEGACRSGLLDRVLFPAPSRVLLVTLQSAHTIGAHTLRTLGLAGLAFSLACLLAVPAGLLLGRFPLAHRLLRPSVDGLRTLPSAAIIPVAILLLGIQLRMQVAVVAFGTLWPVLLATMDAVHGIPPIMRDTIRTLRLTPGQAFLRVLLPATLPGILTGMRIALSIALILAVTVEMIAGDSGLGFYVLDTERAFRFAEMYGGVAVLGLVGAAVNGGLLLLERRLVFWQGGDWT